MKFQKNHWFFDVLGSNSKKTLGFFGILQNFQKNLEFSKIPKFSKLCLSLQIFLEFWNFGKPDVLWQFFMWTDGCIFD